MTQFLLRALFVTFPDLLLFVFAVKLRKYSSEARFSLRSRLPVHRRASDSVFLVDFLKVGGFAGGYIHSKGGACSLAEQSERRSGGVKRKKDREWGTDSKREQSGYT